MGRSQSAKQSNSKPVAKGELSKVRIDKWLWAARFFKTRSLATTCVDGGKVKVNDERVKPAYGVQVGDVISLPLGWDEVVVVVKGLAEKRGSATIAQGLYDETEASKAERQRRADNRKLIKDPALEIKARPTKRNRRAMDNFRWGDAD